MSPPKRMLRVELSNGRLTPMETYGGNDAMPCHELLIGTKSTCIRVVCQMAHQLADTAAGLVGAPGQNHARSRVCSPVSC